MLKNDRGRPPRTVNLPQPTPTTEITRFLCWVLSRWSRTLRAGLLLLMLALPAVALPEGIPDKAFAGFSGVAVGCVARRIFSRCP